MSEYDSMSFKELVQETINHSCNDLLLPPDDWLDMMRRAVIREASAGVATIEVLQGRRRMHSNAIRQLPNGNYDLIPKATP